MINIPYINSNKEPDSKQWFQNYAYKEVTDIAGNSYFCWAAQLQNKNVTDFFCDYFLNRVSEHALTKFFNTQNMAGDTAMHIAVKNGYDYFVERFLNKHRARFINLATLANQKKQTVPMLCFKYGHSHLLQILKPSFSSLDSLPLRKRRNPAHLAVLNNNLEFVNYFNNKDEKKYFYRADAAGSLPIHYAAKYGFTDILCYFLSHFPDLRDKTDNDGNTPLYKAIERERLDAVKYLVSQESDLYNPNQRGKNSFYIAEETKNKKLIEFIERCQIYKPKPESLAVEVTAKVCQGGGVKGGAYSGSEKGVSNPNYVTSKYFKLNVKEVYGASAGAITAFLLGLGFNVATDLNAAELKKVTDEITFDLLLKNKDDVPPSYPNARKNFSNIFKTFKNSSLNLDRYSVWTFFFLIIKYAKEILLPKAGAKTEFWTKFILETTMLSNVFIPNLLVSVANAFRIANWWLGVADLELELCKAFGLKDANELKEFVETLGNNLIERKGIFDGKEIHQWFHKVIDQRTMVDGKKTPNMTFAELAKLAKEHPELGIKDVHVVAVNITNGQTRVFSQHTTPNVVIVDALLASMSIPGFYVPCHIRHKQLDGSLITDGDLYVDGGFFDNYPAWTSQRDENRHVVANDKMLGYRLVTAEQKRVYECPDVKLIGKPIDGAMDYIMNIIAGYFSKQESDHFWNKTEQDRTVYIDHKDYSPIDFDINTEEKERLENSGALALYGFLAREFSRNYELALKKARENAFKKIKTSPESPSQSSQNRYSMWTIIPVTIAVTAATTAAILTHWDTIKEKLKMS